VTEYNAFSDRLLHWWHEHGRHDLPWQGNRDPYCIWVAEIMLQQTQVATVIPYFEAFMATLPSVRDLADANEDDVLALWSGLGYYSRARNLQRAARICRDRYSGNLPLEPQDLQNLPGIGPSTANAIVSQATDRPLAILDGNVKRVLARHAGVGGWPGRSAVARELWAEAEARVPPRDGAAYTQAIMDLGATLCRRRNPRCLLCPVSTDCAAHRAGREHELPTPRPARERPERATTMLIDIDHDGRLLLVRRPPAGIWGGLWSLPEAGADLPAGEDLEPIRHGFTHFVLTIRPRIVKSGAPPVMIADHDYRRVTPALALQLGLPKPVREIIEAVTEREQ